MQDGRRPCLILCLSLIDISVECILQRLKTQFVNLRALLKALVYVHRCFFAQAINDSPHDPMKSQYAPSFLAGYRSACELLGAVRVQYHLFPAHVARFWNIWTHTFSATVSNFIIASLLPRLQSGIVAGHARVNCDTCNGRWSQIKSHLGGNATAQVGMRTLRRCRLLWRPSSKISGNDELLNNFAFTDFDSKANSSTPFTKGRRRHQWWRFSTSSQRYIYPLPTR